MPLELEELFEEYRRQSLNELEKSTWDLETIFENEFRKLNVKIVDSFENNRFNTRYLDEYIHDSMRDLKTRLLREEMNKKEEDFLENYRSALRQIQEISSMRLDINELNSRFRGVIARFESSISIPQTGFIEYYFEEFRNNISRKYDVSSNYDLKFEINRIIRKSSDDLMEEYYSSIRGLNSYFVNNLTSKIDESMRFISKQNEQIDKIDDIDSSLDPNKPIETNGKTEAQLLEEQRVLGERIMNDPNMPFEEKMDLYVKVMTAYQNAINNIAPQLNGQISIKGKTVKDLEEEKRKAIERVTNNPNLDIDEVFEELERIKTLYDAAIKSVSPIEITDLSKKTQDELAAEKEEAIRKIMEDTTMTNEEKMELYDRVVAQFDAAIEKAPTSAKKAYTSVSSLLM